MDSDVSNLLHFIFLSKINKNSSLSFSLSQEILLNYIFSNRSKQKINTIMRTHVTPYFVDALIIIDNKQPSYTS
jgi:hypothetical protein